MTWKTRPRSDFGDLRAIIAGDGPTVLLLHGVGLRAEAWDAQIDALSQAAKVIAPDMPGHGESEMFAGPASLARYVDLVASAIEAPAVVVGHSMGAMIALDLAARYPTKVRAVAALNAIHQRSPEASAAVRARAADLDGLSLADPSGTLDRWFGVEQCSTRQACETWLRTVTPAGYRAAYGVFAQEDGPTAKTLKQLEQPALFMTGGREPNSTPAMSQRMAALAPKGRVSVIPDAAHMMPMTHAAAVNAALVDLLESCST